MTVQVHFVRDILWYHDRIGWSEPDFVSLNRATADCRLKYVQSLNVPILRVKQQKTVKLHGSSVTANMTVETVQLLRIRKT